MNTSTPDTFKLSFSFDAARLRADLERVEPSEWVPHFNTRYYEGVWSAAALRSVGGSATQIYPDPTAQAAYADTPTLARCDNIRRALATFRCPLLSARLLKLEAGSRIREHRDYNLGYEDGEVRIHVPVVTSDEAEFYLGGRRVVMRAGESWYLNFNLPHRVENNGATDRIHLVVDCVVNDWLRSQLAFD
jgi:quercetin dioxygenase-like cupin family protein